MKKIKKKKYQKPTSECVEVASIYTIVISGGGNASGGGTGGAPPPMQSPSRPHWGLNDPSEEEEEDNTMFGRLW